MALRLTVTVKRTMAAVEAKMPRPRSAMMEHLTRMSIFMFHRSGMGLCWKVISLSEALRRD